MSLSLCHAFYSFYSFSKVTLVFSIFSSGSCSEVRELKQVNEFKILIKGKWFVFISVAYANFHLIFISNDQDMDFSWLFLLFSGIHCHIFRLITCYSYVLMISLDHWNKMVLQFCIFQITITSSVQFGPLALQLETVDKNPRKTPDWTSTAATLLAAVVVVYYLLTNNSPAYYLLTT